MHSSVHVGEASVGCYWTTEDRTMTPEVSKLVETFIAVNWHAHTFTHSQRVLAFPTGRHPQQDL